MVGEPFNTCYATRRTDTKKEIWMGIGTGGYNRGLYYNTLDSDGHVVSGDWGFHVDANDIVYIKHIPMAGLQQASAIKVGSAWTGGGINFVRYGNIVHCQCSPNMAALSTRTKVATIPVGYRPIGTVYAHENGTTQYWLFDTDGSIYSNGGTAGYKYFSIDYVATPYQ